MVIIIIRAALNLSLSAIASSLAETRGAVQVRICFNLGNHMSIRSRKHHQSTQFAALIAAMPVMAMAAEAGKTELNLPATSVNSAVMQDVLYKP